MMSQIPLRKDIKNKRSFDKIYLKIVQNAILQSEERPEGVGANERDEKIKREWK